MKLCFLDVGMCTMPLEMYCVVPMIPGFPNLAAFPAFLLYHNHNSYRYIAL